MSPLVQSTRNDSSKSTTFCPVITHSEQRDYSGNTNIIWEGRKFPDTTTEDETAENKPFFLSINEISDVAQHCHLVANLYF